MSDRTNPEDRLRDAMRAYAELVEPAPDAWARIRERVDRPTARSRRARGWQVSLAGFAAAAVVVLVVVGLVALRSEDDDEPGIAGPRVSTTPTEATGGGEREPLPNFVAVKEDGSVVVITNADGREREIADGADADSTLAVAPDGTGVYFDRPGSRSSECGPNREIVFVPIESDKPRVVAKNATDPAVSADGKRLAYVKYAGSSGCLNPSALVVKRIKADSERTWSVAGDDDIVFAPSWGPDSRRVTFGLSLRSGFVSFRTMNVKTAETLEDSEEVLLPQNPRIVLVYGHYGLSEQLLGTADLGGQHMVAIDPSTGEIRALFRIEGQLNAESAAASPQGQNVLYIGSADGEGRDLYVWQEVAPTAIAFTEGILAAAFLPAESSP